jgi:hypothetical protein
MQLTPWDIPAPNADDPAPRFVKPIPANDLHAIFNTHRPVLDDRPNLYDGLCSEAEAAGVSQTPRARRFLLWLGTFGCIGIAAFAVCVFVGRYLATVLS